MQQTIIPTDVIKSIATRLRAGDIGFYEEAAARLEEYARPEFADLTIDLDRNVMKRFKTEVPLTPNQAAMVFKLNSDGRRIFTAEELRTAVYGANASVRLSTVRALLTDLRPALYRIRVLVTNQHQRGYRLELWH